VKILTRASSRVAPLPSVAFVRRRGAPSRSSARSDRSFTSGGHAAGVRAALAALAVVVAVVAPGAVAHATGTPPANTAGAVHPVVATDAAQVIVVSAPSWGSSTATVTGYDWDGARWRVQVGPIVAGIGVNGLTATPHEADGFTPVGEYAVTTVFGSQSNPATAMPYRQATGADHWVDDPTSPLYNTWQTGPASGRWASAENLVNYPYAVAFDFNQNPVVPDGNSAIFLHGGGGATPGCIEIDEADLVTIMRWLDPASRPRIVLGVSAAPPPHLAAPPAPPPSSTPPPAVVAARTGPAPAAAARTTLPAPTTLPPTTAMPTTAAPTTLAPTTLAPTTLAPTTLAPASVTPTIAQAALTAALTAAAAPVPAASAVATSRGMTTPVAATAGGLGLLGLVVVRRRLR